MHNGSARVREVREVRTPEWEERKTDRQTDTDRWTDKVVEILAKNNPQIWRKRSIKTSRSSNSIYIWKSITKHMEVKLLKNKERLLKAEREVNSSYMRSLIRYTADFLSETVETRRQQGDILNILKEKNITPIFYKFFWKMEKK